MNRKQAESLTRVVLDQSGGLVEINSPAAPCHLKQLHDCWLIGFYGPGDQATVIGVRSYLGGILDQDEAVQIATDYMVEWRKIHPERAADFAVAPNPS